MEKSEMTAPPRSFPIFPHSETVFMRFRGLLSRTRRPLRAESALGKSAAINAGSPTYGSSTLCSSTDISARGNCSVVAPSMSMLDSSAGFPIDHITLRRSGGRW